jgi:hypothetical protein
MNTFEEYQATVKQIIRNEGAGTPLIADSIEKVIQEFKNPNYTWRSLRGIAEETEITQTAAAMIIMALIEENVLLTKRNLNSQGNKMYSFRGHHRSVYVDENFDDAVIAETEPEELDELEQPVVQLTAAQPEVSEESLEMPLQYKHEAYEKVQITDAEFAVAASGLLTVRPSKRPAMFTAFDIEACYKSTVNDGVCFFTHELPSGNKYLYRPA